MPEPLWYPSESRANNTLLAMFMREINVGLNDNGLDYEVLHSYSIEEMKTFWSEFWRFSGLIGTPSNIIIDSESNILKTRFFPEAQLNYAENLFSYP